MTDGAQSQELPPDLSLDELAALAGVDAPRLVPGDHPMNVDLDLALYWPVGADHPLQERR
jgi:hypothetical protein